MKLEWDCPTTDGLSHKAVLWCIDCGTGWWADDDGGNLFTSERMAQKTADKYKAALERVGYKIRPCGLDDDLAQLGNLYHERSNAA